MRARHAIATELEKKQEGMKYCLALSHSSTEIIVGARSGGDDCILPRKTLAAGGGVRIQSSELVLHVFILTSRVKC